MNCPSCKSDASVIPIHYGFIIPNAEQDKGKGEYVLGGCMITEDQPTHYCKTCKIRFNASRKIDKGMIGEANIYGSN